MKLAITGFKATANGDDSILKMLQEAGFEVADITAAQGKTGEEKMLSILKDADAVIASLEKYDDNILAQCPNLKVISRCGIGYDAVDLKSCRARGISVLRTVGAVEGAVAEHVMAYLMHFARRLDLQSASMHEGVWKRAAVPGAKSRTLGLVGFGGIGKEIAKRAVPFGMKVIYYARRPQPEAEAEYGVSYCDLDELLAVSDYVSVNVPLTPETRGMFGSRQFAAMRKDSVFINISRGPVAVERELAEALLQGRLRGAGIDVFEKEPCTDSPLLQCPTAVLTPHSATTTTENFSLMYQTAAQNIVDYFKGTLDKKMQVV